MYARLWAHRHSQPVLGMFIEPAGKVVAQSSRGSPYSAVTDIGPQPIKQWLELDTGHATGDVRGFERKPGAVLHWVAASGVTLLAVPLACPGDLCRG